MASVTSFITRSNGNMDYTPMEVDQHDSMLDILDTNILPINKNYVHECSRSQFPSSYCRIIKFKSLKYVECLKNFKPENHPYLFIVIIVLGNFQCNGSISYQSHQYEECLKHHLREFHNARSVLIQLSSETEHVSKFFIWELNAESFTKIDENTTNFKTFFWEFINKKFNTLHELFNAAIDAKDCLSLKFLWCFDLSKEHASYVIRRCAKNGALEQFLSALDVFNDGANFIMSNMLRQIVADVENNHSVLSIAIENCNETIVDHISTYFGHYICHLPFDHKRTISSKLFNGGQINVLCNLLENADFPFPKFFNYPRLAKGRLRTIAVDRIKFHKAIKNSREVEDGFEENAELSSFVQKYSNIKIAYSTDNKSALYQALVKSNNAQIYSHLKVKYQFRESENEIKEFEPLKILHTVKITEMSHIDSQGPVKILIARSCLSERTPVNSIMNCRDKIQEWFNEIDKSTYGSDLLKIAAQFDNLKIMFDFDSEWVNHMDLIADNSAYGMYYWTLDWIFIGAKETPKNSENRIRGTIIHEICHCVLYLIFKNGCKPYPKGSQDLIDRLNSILEECHRQMTMDGDDGCNRIISTVFTSYPKNSHPAEIIARIPEMHAHFYNDVDKLTYLRDRYRSLHEYYDDIIMKILRDFNLKKHIDVKRFNETNELLIKIGRMNCKLAEPKNFQHFYENRISVVTTNVASVLLYDIVNFIRMKYGVFYESHCIFTTLRKLKTDGIFKNFGEILLQFKNLIVVIYYEEEISQAVKGFLQNIKFNTLYDAFRINFVLIGPSSTNFEGIIKMESIIELNYYWTSLHQDCQILYLQTQVGFQNSNQKIELYKLISNEKDQNDNNFKSSSQNPVYPIDYLNGFSHIFDNQLLNMIIEGKDILLFKTHRFSNSFNTVFLSRKFINKLTEVKITQDQLLRSETGGIILLSDIAKTGKTWMLKNLAYSMIQLLPFHLVLFVDLQNTINKMEKSKCLFPTEYEDEFALFISMHILKLQHDFELNIFKHMYNIGRVVVLFDGFNEISNEKCKNYVTHLFKTFKSNGGNQLWIATREYCEDYLVKELKPDSIYKLDKFSLYDGIELITINWILEDSGGVVTNEVDYQKNIQKERNHGKYRKLAEDLLKNIPIPNFSNIGHPLFYIVLAEYFISNKDGVSNSNYVCECSLYEIYEKFVNKLLEIWIYGEDDQFKNSTFRKTSNINLNFTLLHQVHAIKIYFPNMSKFFNLKCVEKDWSNEDILSCGLMQKKDGKFYFLHETVCEFFVAKYIVEFLKHEKWSNNHSFFKSFNAILSDQRFNIVRMFINDNPTVKSALDQNNESVQDFSIIFAKNNKIGEEFFKYSEDDRNSLDLKMKTLDRGKIRHISNIEDIVVQENVGTKLKFQMFLHVFLNQHDFEVIFIKNQLSKNDSCLNLNPNTVSALKDMLNDKIDANFVKRCISEDSMSLSLLSYGKYMNKDKHECFVKILQQRITNDDLRIKASEIGGKITESISQEYSLERIKKKKLCKIWGKLQACFSLKNSLDSIELTIVCPRQKVKSILNIASAFCTLEEFHDEFWNLLLNTYNNNEELTDILISTDAGHDNIIHRLVSSQKVAIITKIFEKLESKLNQMQFIAILTSKRFDGRNLLFTAASTKCPELNKFIWNVIYTHHGSENFKNVLNEKDVEGNCIFTIAAIYSSGEVFKFITEGFTQLKIIEPKMIYKDGLGVLHAALKFNKSQELHQYLWEELPKQLSKEVISDLVELDRRIDNNLLSTAVEFNTAENIEVIWKLIRSYLDDNSQCEYLKQTSKNLNSKGSFNRNYNVNLHFQKITREFNFNYREIL